MTTPIGFEFVADRILLHYTLRQMKIKMIRVDAFDAVTEDVMYRDWVWIFLPR